MSSLPELDAAMQPMFDRLRCAMLDAQFAFEAWQPPPDLEADA